MQKLVGEMEETERKRRIAEEKDEGQSKARVAAINKLITVQEDLLRFINLKKVLALHNAGISAYHIDISMSTGMLDFKTDFFFSLKRLI